MDGNKNFFRTVGKALNPVKYDDLSERRTKDAWKYLFSFMFLAFIVMILVGIPLLIQAPSYLSAQLEKFDKFEINFETEMTDEVLITESSPRLIVDTRTSRYNFTDNTEANMIITDEFFYWKSFVPFSSKYYSTPIDQHKDVLSASSWYSNWLVIILIFMIPSLLVLAYIIFTIKYLLLIVLAAIIGLIVTRLLKFNASFASMFRTGVYAITPAILLELTGLVFNFSQYQIHYAVFAIFFILGTIKAGELEEDKPRKTRPKFSMKHKGSKKKNKKKSDHYVELKSDEF